MSEQETNEAVSKEQPVESSQPVEQNPSETVSSNSAVEESVKIPTDKPEESAPEWDAKTNYDELKKSNDALVQQIENLQPAFTRKSQEAAEMRKQIEGFRTMLEKATETPIDSKQFFMDFEKQGPKVFDPIFQKRETALRSEIEKIQEENQNAIGDLQYQVAKWEMRSNPSFPDFEKLEPAMAKLIKDETVSLDMSQGAHAVYETLYKLVRNMNTDQAIKDTRALSKQEADAQAAKEADAKVAGGGKTGAVTSPANMTIEQERKFMIGQIGVTDDNGQ